MITLNEQKISDAGLEVYIAAKATLVKMGFDEGQMITGEIAFRAAKAFEAKLEALGSEVV